MASGSERLYIIAIVVDLIPTRMSLLLLLLVLNVT